MKQGFTDEQMIDICRARERLADHKRDAKVNEDYSKPFYVGINNPRGFKGVSRDGYLPPLELPEERTQEESQQIIVEHVNYVPPLKVWQLRNEMDGLKGHILFLEKKLNKHTEHLKKKPKPQKQPIKAIDI